MRATRIRPEIIAAALVLAALPTGCGTSQLVSASDTDGNPSMIITDRAGNPVTEDVASAKIAEVLRQGGTLSVKVYTFIEVKRDTEVAGSIELRGSAALHISDAVNQELAKKTDAVKLDGVRVGDAFKLGGEVAATASGGVAKIEVRVGLVDLDGVTTNEREAAQKLAEIAGAAVTAATGGTGEGVVIALDLIPLLPMVLDIIELADEDDEVGRASIVLDQSTNFIPGPLSLFPSNPEIRVAFMVSIGGKLGGQTFDYTFFTVEGLKVMRKISSDDKSSLKAAFVSLSRDERFAEALAIPK